MQKKCDGESVTTVGAVITRQRPGTPLGSIFLSMEDETGIAEFVIHPDLYERERALVTRGKFLKAYSGLQNQHTVVHVKAKHLRCSLLRPLTCSAQLPLDLPPPTYRRRTSQDRSPSFSVHGRPEGDDEEYESA
ncbi:hypothetical protein [Bryocella elongata]|uniref:hypothetical protein n=1 Tax=Bryocella elongata TaxID=863522 RepID=UPI000CDEF900|nr:hypothetical protein [Bryocella elongata]